MATAAVLRGRSRQALLSYRTLRAALCSDPHFLIGVAAAPQPLPPLAGGLWARSMTNCAPIKPVVNVITIGPIGHGKTTLTSALAKVVGEAGTYKAVSVLGRNESPGEELPTKARLEYETQKKRYAHMDFPGHADYLKIMLMGGAPIDAALLVVSAAHCPAQEIKEHILLARQVGIPTLVCFLNKVDAVDNPKIVDLIELKLRELLGNYPGNDVPIVCGSALSALQGNDGVIGRGAILKLIDALDGIQLQGQGASIVKATENNDILDLIKALSEQKDEVEQKIDPSAFSKINGHGTKLIVMTEKQLACLLDMTVQVSAANSIEVARQAVAAVDNRVTELEKSSKDHMEVTVSLDKKTDTHMERTRTQSILQGATNIMILALTGLIIFLLWKIWDILQVVWSSVSDNFVVNSSRKAWDKTKQGWDYLTSFWK